MKERTRGAAAVLTARLLRRRTFLWLGSTRFERLRLFERGLGTHAWILY